MNHIDDEFARDPSEIDEAFVDGYRMDWDSNDDGFDGEDEFDDYFRYDDDEE
jgi:hypothetical protein